MAAGLVLTLCSGALAACSAGPDEPGPTSWSKPSSADRTAPLQLRTQVTRVAGELAPRHRRAVAMQTRRVMQEYVAAAFLGERDSIGGAFPGFTSGAARLARRDRGVLTGRSFRGADEVTVIAAAAYVAVVAPTGRPVGATARLSLDLDVVSGETTRPVRVRGRLLLTPARGHGGKPDGKWRIFGYDLSRSGAGPAEGGL